jgi:hypothetical protein
LKFVEADFVEIKIKLEIKMASIAIQIPEEFLIEALSHLPYKKRLDLWKKIELHTIIDLKLLKAEKLDNLIGIVSIGGDAVIDTESIFDE